MATPHAPLMQTQFVPTAPVVSYGPPTGPSTVPAGPPYPIPAAIPLQSPMVSSQSVWLNWLS